jgi:hypothetical protein
MAFPRLRGLNIEGMQWGNLADELPPMAAPTAASLERRAREKELKERVVRRLQAPILKRRFTRKKSAARKIQSTFRKARAKFAARSGRSRAASIRQAKSIGAAVRRRLGAPVKATYTGPDGTRDYWMYESRKALKDPQEGQMRWKLLPTDVNLPTELARPDEGTFEILVGEGAARQWVRAHDPMGTYGGPYSDPRNLFEHPRKRANNAEAALAMQSARENTMRARAAAAAAAAAAAEAAGAAPVLIPEDDAKAIAARFGKVAQKEAKDANPAMTKAEAGAIYTAEYNAQLARLQRPGVTLADVLAEVQAAEARAGIVLTAREARRMLARTAAASGGPGGGAGGEGPA